MNKSKRYLEKNEFSHSFCITISYITLQVIVHNLIFFTQHYDFKIHPCSSITYIHSFQLVYNMPFYE